MWRQKRRKQMRLKNEKERNEFLKDYRNGQNGWYLWKEDDDINRKMRCRELPDCALIVEEQQITYRWPHEHIDWSVMHWYIIEDWSQPFADGQASRTQAFAKLKEYGRSGREI